LRATIADFGISLRPLKTFLVRSGPSGLEEMGSIECHLDHLLEKPVYGVLFVVDGRVLLSDRTTDAHSDF
jgi:hypothetical protein